MDSKSRFLLLCLILVCKNFGPESQVTYYSREAGTNLVPWSAGFLVRGLKMPLFWLGYFADQGNCICYIHIELSSVVVKVRKNYFTVMVGVRVHILILNVAFFNDRLSKFNC